MPLPKVVVTCFAGRKSCMTPLLHSIKKLIENGLVDEFHLWNYAKQNLDDAWLKDTFTTHNQGLSLITKTTSGYNYIHSGLTIRSGELVKVSVKAESDVYIMLRSKLSSKCYEICIGGWNNSKSVIRNQLQGHELGSCRGKLLKSNKFVDIILRLSWNYLDVLIGSKEISIGTSVAEYTLDVFDIYLSSYHNRTCEWCYEDPFDFGHSSHMFADKIKLMLPADRRPNLWIEYYKHYNDYRYPNNVIIKCDDDICYIDTNNFSSFIQKRLQEREFIFIFPSIVNNELCAFYQQQHDLIPKEEVGEMFYEPLGSGSLWKDGHKAQRLHAYFLGNMKTWQNISQQLTDIQTIKQGDRISINFFAVLSKDLYIYQLVVIDDEGELTQVLPTYLNRSHGIMMNYIVSHLAFCKQRETGLDSSYVIKQYCDMLENIG